MQKEKKSLYIVCSRQIEYLGPRHWPQQDLLTSVTGLPAELVVTHGVFMETASLRATACVCMRVLKYACVPLT